MYFRICLLGLCLLLASSTSAVTITVRKDGTGDYAVIQQALDVAASGDTILVGPGEFTESSMVRLSGYGFDIESFGCFRATNVTLIGSGMGVTIIGPTSYYGGPGILSPKCIVQDLNGGWLRISDLTMRNCYDGLFMVGLLYMDRCQALDNAIGVFWANVGSGGWIRDSRVDDVAYSGSGTTVAFDIGAAVLGSDVVVEDCVFQGYGVVRGVQNMAIRGCALSGLELYAGAQLLVSECTASMPDGGIVMALGGGAYCEVRDSTLRRDWATLAIDQSAPGSRFVVENCLLEGGAHGVLYSGDGAGSCEIHNCDLVKGSGPMVECAFSNHLVTHDLSNNYWGTSSETEIQGWIYDRNDNLGRGGAVIYNPFAGQSLPTESTLWGDLKASFR